MRTWGRVSASNGTKSWMEVTTDASGDNSTVYLTTLIQCLKLNIGESPIYGNYGINAQQSLVTQIFPDFYTNQTQSQFAQYFVSLTVKKLPLATPTYDISAITHSGAVIAMQVPT